MRTTVRLDDTLFTEVKKHAAQTGSTLTSLIEQALREMLQRRETLRVRRPVKLRTWGHGGLQAGVDLDSSAALLDVMEGEDDPL
jgi:predicted transcriptional regulator